MKANGLYFDLFGIRLPPTTEISANDQMHFSNLTSSLPDSYLTSA